MNDTRNSSGTTPPPSRRRQQAQRARDAADAQVSLAKAKLALAQAERRKNDVAARDVEAALTVTQKAAKNVDLAQTGNAHIHEAELQTVVKKAAVEDAKDQPRYTKIRAPFPGVVVKRYRHLGDFASPGVAVLSMYNPDLLYVDGQPGGDPAARRRPRQPGASSTWTPSPSRSRAASSGSTNRPGPVRADAAERGLRRVHQGRAARARAHLDREGRPLAAIAGRPVGRT